MQDFMFYTIGGCLGNAFFVYIRTEPQILGSYLVVHQYIKWRTLFAHFPRPVLMYSAYTSAHSDTSKSCGVNLLIFGNLSAVRTNVLFFSTLYESKKEKKP